MRNLFQLLLLASLITACAPRTGAAPTPQVITVYASPAAQPWQTDLFTCAADLSLSIELNDTPTSADIQLRLGEPPDLDMPAYQVGSDDILVVIHPETGISTLTLEQVRNIFTGRVRNWSEVGGNDIPIEVWAFSSTEDIEEIFEQAVLDGLRIMPQANLAVTAQAMSDAVGTTPGAIGILNRRWKAGNTREAFLITSVPVLAISRTEESGVIKDLLACLQK